MAFTTQLGRKAIGLRSVSIAMLLMVSVALPGLALAASGGDAISGSTTTPIRQPGGAGGNDGTASQAVGQPGGVLGVSIVGGGGGAVDLTTGNGAAGGGSRFTDLNPGAAGSTGAPGSTTAPGVVNGTITGGNGGIGLNSSTSPVFGGTGGGGGGVGLVTGSGLIIGSTGTLTGGNGGRAGSSSGGGGGGVGALSSGDIDVQAGGRIMGGAGGNGSAFGGAGGGAAALVMTAGGTLTNSGALTGGAGGNTQNIILPNGGAGGSGGEGVLLTNGGRIVNTAGASITGGVAGTNGPQIAPYGVAASVGGDGIKGANLSVLNAGTIAGGSAANAISFTGGSNSLELWSTSVITGNVMAAGGDDVLALGGSGSGVFSAGLIGAGAQYDGFERFEKTGTSTWLLTGTTLAATPWTLSGGILSIAADGSLGDMLSPLTFNGGTLQTTASFNTTRSITLTAAGGTIETDPATTLVLSGTINGAGALSKTGDGTLELTGQNSFTGQTLVSAGTLALSGAGSIAASQRVVVDGTLDISGTTAGAVIQSLAGTGVVVTGTQVLTLSHANDSFSGQFAGTGDLVLTAGRETLTGDSSAFAGATRVLGGTLAVDGQLGGSMDIFGGRLQGHGTVGTTINHAGGMIAPGNSIGTLTVAGDYTSNGGGLEIEAQLGDDASPTDLLLVTGSSLLGLAPTPVTVINIGGMGAPTTAGIKIVDVQGIRSDADAFVLNGPAIGGAYRYNLFQNDTATGSDGDWYLRRGALAPTVPVFENYPITLIGMINLPTLRQRVGAGGQGIVTRIEGSAGHSEASSSTSHASYDNTLFLVQLGATGTILDTADGSLAFGLTAQYSTADANVFSPYGDGSNSTEGFGLGASLTWRGAEGSYLDLQGQLAHFSTSLNAAGYSLIQDNGGSGLAVGIEAGHAFTLDDAWSLTPQGQLSYASVGFDSFTDRFGSVVSLNSGDSLKGRLGVALDYQNPWQDAQGRKAASTLYGVSNLTYEFLDGATVAVSGTDLSFSGQKFGAELGLGGTLDWADSAHALNGELLASTSFAGSYALKGTLGFTSRF